VSVARPADRGHVDPLAAWIESTFGLVEDETGSLIRSAPTTVPAAAELLVATTGIHAAACARAIRNMLLAGSQARHPDHGRPLFAFRLHQFVSKGDTVHVSLEPEGVRHITGQYQLRVPHHREKALLPLGFCRECGQEYYVVSRVSRSGFHAYVPRHNSDASGGDAVTGYLYVSGDHP
jgi:hypothetical protein